MKPIAFPVPSVINQVSREVERSTGAIPIYTEEVEGASIIEARPEDLAKVDTPELRRRSQLLKTVYENLNSWSRLARREHKLLVGQAYVRRINVISAPFWDVVEEALQDVGVFNMAEKTEVRSASSELLETFKEVNETVPTAYDKWVDRVNKVSARAVGMSAGRIARRNARMLTLVQKIKKIHKLTQRARAARRQGNARTDKRFLVVAGVLSQKPMSLDGLRKMAFDKRLDSFNHSPTLSSSVLRALSNARAIAGRTPPVPSRTETKLDPRFEVVIDDPAEYKVTQLIYSTTSNFLRRFTGRLVASSHSAQLLQEIDRPPSQVHPGTGPTDFTYDEITASFPWRKQQQ